MRAQEHKQQREESRPRGRRRFLGDESGQAMVEMGFMLFILGPALMVLVVIYNLVDEMVTVQEELRYELRVAIDDAAAGPFRKITIDKTATVEVPGRLDELLGDDTLEVDMSLTGYGGCYQGVGMSEYATFIKVRQVTGWW